MNVPSPSDFFRPLIEPARVVALLFLALVVLVSVGVGAVAVEVTNLAARASERLRP